MKIRQMTAAEFWPKMKKLEPKVFKIQTYAAYEQMTTHEKSGFENRKKFLKDRIELYFGLFNAKEEFVGWTSSFQIRPNEIYMGNSAVLPKYQRKGWYTKLAQTFLKEAERLGFQTVKSYHTASNNSVIIAKLKMGFRISGIQISDEMGILVQLTYFLNPVRDQVLKYRTGEIFPTAKIKKLLKLK